jgi:acyl-CoA oxidase
MGAADAFLDVQPHALHAARAEVEVWLHRAMSGFVDRAEDEGLTDTLASVEALSDLRNIGDDLGWFLQHGLLTSAGASDVRDSIVELSQTLAGDARHLVDGFAIPDEILSAPIAL